MRTIQELVRAEVVYCVSGLVATLANAAGSIAASDRDAMRRGALTDLQNMAEQACELASSIPDYESAAIDAGWKWNEDAGAFNRGDDETWLIESGDWRELCDSVDIEPHDREVYEHWIVSDWLAEKLEAKGEKVDRDFAGMTVWARTTTGQSIEIDSVIVEIHADVCREVEAEGRAND